MDAVETNHKISHTDANKNATDNLKTMNTIVKYNVFQKTLKMWQYNVT